MRESAWWVSRAAPLSSTSSLTASSRPAESVRRSSESSGESEDIPIAGPIDAAVDDRRQGDALGLLLAVIGLLFEHLGQCGLSLNGERHVVGDERAEARGDGNDSGGLASGVHGELAGLQIPALHFDRGALSGAPAEREDAGDERQFAHLDAVD